MNKRRPTRRDLLVIIGRLQGLVGEATANNHDRNPNRYAETMGALEDAFDLCVEALSKDPPQKDTGPWSSAFAVKKRLQRM